MLNPEILLRQSYTVKTAQSRYYADQIPILCLSLDAQLSSLLQDASLRHPIIPMIHSLFPPSSYLVLSLIILLSTFLMDLIRYFKRALDSLLALWLAVILYRDSILPRIRASISLAELSGGFGIDLKGPYAYYYSS